MADYSTSALLAATPRRSASYRVMPPRPFIAAVLLLCFAICTSPAQAQQPAAPVGPVDLDRIRERLQKSPSIFDLEIVPDYRVQVQTDDADLRLKLAWIYDDSITPGYVRPFYPLYHFEMQRMMLPREFTAHLYPIGVPTTDVFNAIGDALRSRRARAERERVRQEAEALRKQSEGQRVSPGTPKLDPPD